MAVKRPVRSRPIRVFLISMVAVPLVSLLALYGFAASITVSNAISDHQYNVAAKAIASGVEGLIRGLPQERVQSYLWLIGGGTGSKTAMLDARHKVDDEVPAVRAALNTQQSLLSAQSRSELNTLFTELGRLGKTRAAIDSGAMTPTDAFGVYDTIVDHLFLYFDTSVQDRGASLTAISVGASDSGYAFEVTTRELALVGGALLNHGQISEAARTLFASSVATRRQLMNEALALMTPDLSAGYVTMENSPPYRQFQAMENRILASPGRAVPVTGGQLQSVSNALVGTMVKAQLDNGKQLTALSASRSDRLVTEAALAGGLGLVAVVASVFLLVWFGRKVTRDLGGLNDSVRGMADERLPRVVERLRRGDDVDVDAESPPPATSTIQEVSRIAESFGTVQAAAVEAAVDQARLRKGVNQVFLNISMRNQSLLHRQLAMLDSMERRTSEPGALADLFRLDHLTTRMRRHAEGLIILSGAVPGRGWRDPVPVVDILRAAVAEVEDYVRVDVTSESDDLVAGNAVSDVIHLIAELIENAAAFSPPNTRIEVRAERVGTGLVAEVEDRGLGMSPDELDDVNARLASLPEFDLAHSDQLGLFVVSRLAARHAIKVSLRRSVYGGTMAVVLMPFGVVVRQEEASRMAPWGGRPAESEPRSLTGRHRLPPPAVPAGLTGPAGPGPGAPNGKAEWPMAPWETQPITMPPEATAAGPALFSPPAPLPPPAPSALTAPAAPPSGSHLGMPIRVPQTSMAPQLRAQRGADPQEPLDPRDDEPWFGARSPEATRSMLTMMQQGWRRGRMDDLDDPEGVPGTGTD
ncbi:MAG TPA: nitrate- and nitrite sensing domain-containing protein [Streptosporangiaceae bacterium]|nr:nitrate- and nitrite sensing domain-containing protein [Streptosporangiaceae bacterium]